MNATSATHDRRAASSSTFTGQDKRDNRLRRKSDVKLASVFAAGVLTGGIVVTLATSVLAMFIR